MYPKGYNMNDKSLSEYVKQMRKEHNLTQVELSEKSGVGLRFVRELEQGKQTLRLDKVNQVLSLFGTEVGVVPMRQALIYNQDQLAGLLTEDENGYTFQYDTAYIKSSDAESISLTLPISEKPYTSLILFPFFDGLIPEGWLLDIAEKSWKINRRDRMSLLLACCKDCIGAVSVIPILNKE